MKRKRSSFKEITAAFLFLIMVVTVTFSASYAVLSAQIRGQKSYSLAIGDFDFSFKNEQNSISLLNAYPMTDEEGKQLEAYKFSVTNTGDYKGDYTISLVEAEEKKSQCTNCTFLDPSMLRYELTKEGNKQTPKDVVATTLLDEGTLKPKESANYELRIWLKQEATVAEEGKIYYGKIKVEAVQSTQNTLGTVSDYAFDTNNLGESCKTYDDGTDTFLVGQCKQNYVWYSGKLWRVVLKNNETGAVKMVTDNAITSISFHSSNITFENSYVDQWLSQEFLPTLHDYEGYLITNGLWDVSSININNPTRSSSPTEIERVVGLLNSYEYYTTFNNSNGLSTYETGYLNNQEYWWLLTPISSPNVTAVNSSGKLSGRSSVYVSGVRPSIILKSNIQIISGDGTESNPYRLEGDSKEIINGTTLLSTRYSGEYIKFNNELYRIVGVEDTLAKITAVDKPSALFSNSFYSEDGVIFSFADSNIRVHLSNYYQGLNAETKNLIEPNTKWYLGVVGAGASYKASICSTIETGTDTRTCAKTTSVTTNIGLSRTGELFTSQISRGTKSTFWTLTPDGNSHFYYVSAKDGVYYIGNATEENGARPSMYLKQNVVISKDNTGDGTYEHPYDIELGS